MDEGIRGSGGSFRGEPVCHEDLRGELVEGAVVVAVMRAGHRAHLTRAAAFAVSLRARYAGVLGGTAATGKVRQMFTSCRMRWAAAGALAIGLLAACNGDEDGVQVVVDPTGTNTPTQVQVGSVTRNPTDEPSITPGPTDPPDDEPDDGEVLPCGDILVPINKQNSLAADCAPAGLVTLPAEYSYNGTQELIGEAADAFVEMMEAAKQDGFTMVTRSTYRSYSEQASTFQYWVDTLGLEYAQRTSARAGHSEHQLGTTADVTSASAGYELEGFEGTAEAAWLAEHAPEFGFVISYPAGTEHITGYAYEPWHVRYVGRDVAAQVEASGVTLHEFLQ